MFRKDNCGGTAFLVRYADDFVAGFQYRGDAYRFRAALGNWRGLKRFHDDVVLMLYRRLNRRSQMRSFNWKGFLAMLSHYGMEQSRLAWGGEDQPCLSLA